MKILAFVFTLIATVGHAQHSLEKIWETDSTLAVPESVLFDKEGIFVSLIDGTGGWDVDGKGEIAKIDKNGKILNPTWVTGLNAPKGMGIHNKKLYAADITDVVVVNLSTGKIDSKIPVEGAQGLNDITIDGKGVVYVSDSKLGQVYKITNGKSELFISDQKGINGLKAVGSDLYMLTGTGVFKADASKKVESVSPMDMGGDGIEPVGNGDYVVSCWPGVIYYLSKDGKMQSMLDTRDQKKMTADIGYDPATRTVYVPTFFKKSVVAYKLK
jgi:hypothetical protein